jgi:hypothetical protein
LKSIVWYDTWNFNAILEFLLEKIQNWPFHCQRDNINAGFGICYIPENSVAISEPVMVGQ